MLHDERYEIVSLLTTCNEGFGRVSMHGVRLELAQAQAQAIGLPMETVFVSGGGSNDEYERKMSASLLAFKERGVTHVAFGDIFLEDLRRWRERQLGRIGLHGIFPLWRIDTRRRSCCRRFASQRAPSEGILVLRFAAAGVLCEFGTITVRECLYRRTGWLVRGARTLDEIASWSTMGEREQVKLLAVLGDRKRPSTTRVATLKP